MSDVRSSSTSEFTSGEPGAGVHGWSANWRGLLVVCVGIAIVGVRSVSIYTESVNWDEFNLVHNAAWTLQSNELHAGGRAGLAVLTLLPFVVDCENEITVVRRARVLWMFFTLAGLCGFGLLLRRLSPNSRRRNADALLGVSLLALVPDFLVWSIQIRADQFAIAATIWGGVALLASRDRPGWATGAGLAFGLGFLSSQKAVYLIVLVGVLAAAEVWRARERQFSREGLRIVLCLSSMGMVIVGFYSLIPQLFDNDSGAIGSPLSALLPALNAETVGRQYQFQMSVFDYYRSTIGYSQYVAMLPTLVPHMIFGALMAVVTLRDWVLRRALSSSLILAWVVLALGLAVGLFHAGAFRYFWMTLGVFPAVALVLARDSVVALLDSFGRPVRRGAVLLFWCGLIVPALVQSASLLSNTQAVQKETIDFARRNFDPSDAGFHAEAGLFCSDDANEFPPYFSQLIDRRFSAAAGCAECAPDLIREFEQKQVKFVVASFRLTQFPPIVQTFWQENYLPYRGSLLVAGKFLKAARDQGRVDLVVDGEYLWLPIAPPAELSIDGRRVRTGERVRLTRGGHDVQFPESDTAGMLVLAMDGPPKPPLQSFYRDF